MAPLIIALGAAGLGFLGYTKFGKPKVQTLNIVGAGGVPVQVLTPIGNSVTPGQAQGVSTAPVAGGAVAQITASGTIYAPAKMLDPANPTAIPILTTPTGSSSVGIGSVLDIQRALNTLGIQPLLTTDGKTGPRTIAAIKAFQKKAGLVADGSAGPATKAAVSNALAALVSGGVTAPIATAANLAVVKGTPTPINTLRDIQHGLNLLGTNPPLQEDGKPGPKTVAAIKSFQLGHGLPVDGIAGPKTKAAIGLALGASAVAPTVAGQYSVGFG